MARRRKKKYALAVCKQTKRGKVYNCRRISRGRKRRKK